MDIDNTRAHIRKCKKQRMRGERIIDVTPSVERSLPVATFAHLQARSGAYNRERGGAAGTAPAAGDPEDET